jgi:hypothetical protein
MFNAKNMERLTELKVGLQLEADVLEAWCRPPIGKNLSHGPVMEWKSSTNVYGSSRPQPITEIPSGADYFRIKNSGAGSLLFRKTGFLDFYNQFYKLDVSTMRTNFDGTRVFIETQLDLDAVLSKLISLDYKFHNDSSKPVIDKYLPLGLYIRSKGDYGFAFDQNGIWPKNGQDLKLITVADILGKPEPKSIRPKLDPSNLNKVEFNLPDKATQDRFLTELFRLGYTLNGEKDLWNYHLDYWRINSNKNISGGAESTGLTLMDYNLILDSKTLNNNYTLNNKTDGKTIIVRKPYPTISRGERPEGNRLSGKTSRTAITSRPIRHRTIRG